MTTEPATPTPLYAGPGRLLVAPAGSDPADKDAWTDFGFSDVDFTGDLPVGVDGEPLRLTYDTTPILPPLTMTVTWDIEDIIGVVARVFFVPTRMLRAHHHRDCGCPRAVRHPGMRTRQSVPGKPSKAARSRGRSAR